MNADTFREHFVTFAEAPNGVAKLRELILQLAVQGKLVQQDENDEPASLLLDRIAGKRRNPSELEMPFCVPSNWSWCRLSEITTSVQYGYTASANANLTDVRLLRITDIQNNIVDWPSVPGCQIDEDDYRSYAIHDDDIVIARTGGTIGKSYIVQGVSVRAVFASYLIRVVPSHQIYAMYLKRFLESPSYWTQLRAMSAGTGQPNVNGTSLKSLLVPLPPVSEQRRIVEKVDQLLGLCDDLASRQESRRAARERLVVATLNRLTFTSAAESASHARRLQDHFDILFDTPTSIPHLRQAILQLAVQGKLVPQDPNDGPAKVVANVIDINRPFAIPCLWRWGLVEQVAESRLGKMLDNAKNVGPPRVYLRNTNVHWMRFDLTSLKEMPFKDEEVEEFEVRRGDVLICEGGHGIGRTAVWDGQCEQVMFQKALHRVRPGKDLDSYFFAFCMRVYDAIGVLQSYYTGAGIPHLTGRSLAKLLFPVPPLAEQKRIVSKVTELLSLCDALESQLENAESASTELLSATVSYMLTEADMAI